jgi:hypothetical protein
MLLSGHSTIICPHAQSGQPHPAILSREWDWAEQSDVKVWGKDSTSGSVVMTLTAHGTDQSLRFGMDTDGRLTVGD